MLIVLSGSQPLEWMTPGRPYICIESKENVKFKMRSVSLAHTQQESNLLVFSRSALWFSIRYKGLRKELEERVQLLSKDDVAAVISNVANRGSSSRRQGKVSIQRSIL